MGKKLNGRSRLWFLLNLILQENIMTTQNRIKAVLTLTVVAMVFLVLPAAADIPGPNDLPDPDTTPPDSTKPVKVFILSGQSNMVGMGNINPLGTLGTLQTITKTDGKFPHLLDASNNWTVRNDVKYRGLVTAIGNGFMTPGVMGTNIGPELGFGHVMGYYYDEPVLVIKSSQGNRSISWDYAPPSTERFEYNGNIYAGYGDSPNSWPVGGNPSPYGWYAGKQYDDCFLHEGDMGPKDWAAGIAYPSGCQVRSLGVVYNAKSAHTSAAASEPGVGAESSTYWTLYSIENVVDILDNFATQYPGYAAQGFEIAGYGWWQGHKDQSDPHSSRYEQNLVRFIKDLRQYYENRYPANTKTDAPFVLATVAFDGGWNNTSTHFLNIANGQLAVSGETGNYPEFEGNVKTVEARGFWRDSSVSPSTAGYHYNNNAETYYLVGDALGRAMAELLTPYSVDAGDDMITWSGESIGLDATVQEGITVSSYAWSADPNDGVVFSDETIEDPTVTITKVTDNPSTVKLTLTVNDGGVNPPVTDSIRIDVYDDACKAAIGKGLATNNPGDFDGNCITDFEDVAVMALAWLNDKGLTAPVAK
jgi:hypothetical protein